MLDRIAATAVFCLFLAMGPLQAQTANGAGTHDSTATAAKAPPAPIEDNLNLDDSGAILAPAKKPATAVPATPAPAIPATSAPAPAAPAATGPATPASVTPATAASPQAGKAPATIKDSVNKAVDEDLILEGGEESLLDQAKIAQKKAAEAKTKTSAADSAHGVQNTTAVPSAVGNPAKGSSPIPTPGSLTVPNSEAAPAAELPVPATIEKTHSLNFANNLRQYRSPKLAMLMSLILPGSGELYAQSDIWAAGFVVAEAALITTGVSLAKTAAAKKQAAHTYADQHYRIDTMKAYIDSNGTLHTFLKANGIDSLFYQTIFSDSSDVTFIKQAGTKSNTYYSLINQGQSSPFIRGWDDVTPASFTGNGYQLTPGDTMIYRIKSSSDAITTDSSYLLQLKSDSTSLLYGQSAHQQVYNGMIQSSLQVANYSRNAYLSLIVNHIFSAFMAGILAKKHNDELLGQESFWQHIGVDVSYVNTGSQTVPAYALQVQF